MSNQHAQRTAQMRAHISAAVMFMLLFGAGSMISPSVESANSAPVSVSTLTASVDEAGQWTGSENLEKWTADEEVRQGFAGAEEHIQAF